MGPDVNKCDALTLVVKKDEQNAVPGVYGPTRWPFLRSSGAHEARSGPIL